MLLDPKKMEEIFKIAAAPLAAVGTFFGLLTAGTTWLAPYIGFGLAAFLSILTACTLLWAAYRLLSKKSKLSRRERFDLRIRSRDDLLGRDNEITNLRSFIDESHLILVDGESGCGKSSLIEFGLMPALVNDSARCPLLVSYYPGDSDDGLAQRIFKSFWGIIPADERKKLGFGDRPAIGTVNGETIKKVLNEIGQQLGRMPILILDQFDDYQRAAREHFEGRRKNWIGPRDLVRRNRTWAAINKFPAIRESPSSRCYQG